MRDGGDEFASRELEHAMRPVTVDPSEWQRLREHDARMRRLQIADFDPGAAVVRSLSDPKSIGVLLTEDAEAEVARWSPDAETPAGWVEGVQVRADTEEPVAGTLLVRLVARDFNRVHPATIRLFSYLEDEASFVLNPLSGVGVNAEYVWARLEAPGKFGVIGLDCDPIMLRTIVALASVQDLLVGAEFEARFRATRGIVESVLSTPEARGWCEGSVRSLPALAFLPGLPRLPFGLDVARVTTDELNEVARHFAEDADPPEAQLIASFLLGA